jgi:concanavalin A-like lectin/glucanase superfamily protein
VRAMRTTLVLLFLCCQAAFGGYAGYFLFQTIPSMAGSSATSPYSLLISGTFPQFATTANGGQVLNTVSCGVNSIVCPADLAFSKDSGCSTFYSGWEIASYSPSTGQITVSVQIPVLSNTHSIRIYGCAGNPAVTTFQGGPRGSAYDSNYLLALHMDETSGTTLHDSTSNANDAVKKASGNPAPAASGKVGGGQTFLGTANSVNNDYALFGSATAPTNTYTIEYWTRASGYINQDSVFLESSGPPPIIFAGFYWYLPGTVLYKNSYNSASPTAYAKASSGAFHYLCFIRNGDSMNVFLDGVAGSSASGFGTGTERWKGLGWDGGASVAFNSFNGVMDEVFFSNVARTPDYVTARYNNLNSPSTFYTVGAFTAVIPAPLSTTRANSQINIF